MIDINGLIPDKITIQVGKNKYKTDLVDGRYILNVLLEEFTETDEVYIYVGNKLFDTIEKRIALRAGDTLHLEYSIDVTE